MRAIRFSWLAALLLLLTPALLHAQALAQRTPADALVYLEWRGTAAMPGYDQSNLKGLMDATNLKQQFTDLIAKAMEQAKAKGPRNEADAQLLKDCLDLMWLHPTAFYFGGVDFTDPDKPMPKLALFCQAGKDAAPLADRLNKRIAERPNKQIPLEAKPAGEFLLVTLGKADDAADLVAGVAKRPIATLAADKTFTTALAQVHQDAALLAYANGTGLLALVDSAVNRTGDLRAKKNWPIASDVLGLENIKAAIVTGAFEDRNFGARAFIQLDSERTGLASLLDHKPLSDGALKLIPKAATWAGVLRFDLARVLTEARATAGRADEGGERRFDTGLRMLSGFMGVDVRNELAACLGDEWVYYGSPEAVGNALRGFTLVNQLKDEKAAVKTFETLEDFINGLIRQRQGPDAKAVFKTTEAPGGYTIHALTLPEVTPSWTIVDGKLIFSLSPQGVRSAADRAKAATAPAAGAATQSLADNPEFAALRKQLGVKEFSSFSFADLPKTASEVYEIFSKLNAQILADTPPGAPTFQMPPLEKIKPCLAPAGAVYWSDKDGWHMKALQPFPGASTFSGEEALIMGALMPAMTRARTQAQRAAGAANLRQIHQGLMVYANDNKDTLPPDLGTLLTTDVIANPRVLVPPRTVIPAEIAKATRDQQAAWVNKNSSYVYLHAGKRLSDIKDPATTPLVHEKLDLPTSADGIHILYADGHVAWTPRQKAEEMLTK